MAHGRARDERKERQWRHWIGEWQASGLSVRAFCQRRRLTVASFHARRRVLRRRAAEKAVFVPVQVVAAGRDEFCTREETEAMARELRATVNVIDGADHQLIRFRREVAGLVVPFVAPELSP